MGKVPQGGEVMKSYTVVLMIFDKPKVAEQDRKIKI